MSFGGRRRALAVAALAALAGSERSAVADETRTAVVLAEGPEGDAVAGSVASRLPASITVRPSRDFRASLGAGSAPITTGLKSRRADADLLSHARAALRETHLDVALLLQVRKSHRATVVHVWLVTPSSASGSAVDQDVNLGPGASPGDEADAVWGAVKDSMPSEPSPAPPMVSTETATPTSPGVVGAAPPATSSESASTPEPASDAPSHETSGDDVRPLLRVSAAIEAGSRHFAYVDRLTTTLRPYDLFAAPLAAIAVEASPFAHSTSPMLQGLGLDAGYAHSFAVSSADASGASVSTNWQSLHADLREMVAIGEVVRAGAHAGFGMIDFTFDGALGAGAELPSVGYRFVRPGLDVRVALREFAVFAEASYLAVLSTGALGSMFPRGSTGGVDAGVGLAWPIARHLDLSFEIAYTRFFYSLNPEPGDSNVAGGALDEMVLASLALGYKL
jgi:hypothetical protein